MSKQDLTSAEKLWIEVFGPRGLPELDERKVEDIVENLSARERLVVHLRFTGSKRQRPFSSIGGKLSLSRETVRLNFRQAIRHLRHSSRRQAWEEAKKWNATGTGTAT
ncbi:MAG: RNA polymerase sigma factor RpoD [Syntrophomonadaceae bacterium]|nr:RNA polymerase sigma factor RpoD [Bacillota bacterium]